MTTKELVLWMDKAIELSEKSWSQIGKPPDGKMGHYEIGRHDALDRTKPKGTLKFEEDIAHSLIHWGNDISDWAKAADDTKSIP